MTKEEFILIKQKFKRYCDNFNLAKDGLPPMLELKYEHSCRVAAGARALSFDLGWPLAEQNTAEALGILHDIGRFPQFAEYGTFSDATSVDHGERGWMVIKEDEWVLLLPSEDRSAILDGVRYHNRRVVPENLSGKSARFLRLIRDADKLDIFRVMLEAVEGNNFQAILNTLPNVTEERLPSSELLDKALDQTSVSISDIHNLGDFLLLQLLWMHDLNYYPAFQRVDKLDFLNRLLCQLNGDSRVQTIGKKLNRILRDRLEQGQRENTSENMVN